MFTLREKLQPKNDPWRNLNPWGKYTFMQKVYNLKAMQDLRISYFSV
jgi:hypothetical protein